MKLYLDDLNLITIENYNNETIEYNGKVLEVNNGQAYINDVELGQHLVCLVDGKEVSVEVRFYVKTDHFDQKYTNSSQVLGSVVKDETTTFTLWAPTAYKVNLLIDEHAFEMNRDAQGFYSITLENDCSGTAYLYEVYRDGQVIRTCDPYAKATLPNRKASVVTNLSFDKVEFQQKSDVILEMHVRDFSMDPEVPFKHRGQFLGMLESHGHYGYQHVKDLGVGVLQLQPVTDFETVDELDPLSAYNWGYDPMQFFALEGSYSSNIQDPQQVLRDFSTLVNQYHRDGFAVTMDVVYNHIYEVEGSSLGACVPYYYFRYVDGKLSDGTFCGNEIASEFTMVRKFIKDACIYFVEQFDIDGYRFDLMGITDIVTMNEIRDELLKIKPHIFLYGEGWNMASGLNESDRATMQNHKALPGYAYFNDLFRNEVGGSLDASDLGILDNPDSEIMNDVLNGSTSIFDSPQQSINYVECHDNYTTADKLAILNLGVKEAEQLIKATVLAKGHPFLQIGQSFYRNKQGVENSYKSPDSINMIRWSYLDKYKELNDFTISQIKLRKSLEPYSIEFSDNLVIKNV